ncbi:hypothetical protein FPZ43_00010 [Mucilaginibacter pallidiroseus]|uniref:Uncharacterized protein n=1 Tax=Mucilaginibacter pallidiroseus TaxID=2599295 RepID=A0A563UHZ1_9SPHI|nr:hypothetical protein FPZ43_00010 [Mucilaginibacter pallidiroseus]
MDALMLFLKQRSSISTRDFTLSNWRAINKIGEEWLKATTEVPADVSPAQWQDLVPSIDVWLSANDKEVHLISDLIPRLDWAGGDIGVRLIFEPTEI